MSGERMEKEQGVVLKNDEVVVQWAKFMPRKVLRVLLIEADDSTRQIIMMLLQKCSYKVVAVDDGLKAWELLKGRPQSIDLILTEVELPSISGYALLTLIADHEVCKNIPVIMMSAHDSDNTVYRCMVKGAADFLVKPIRINELKNMWQHVWRRHASIRDGPQATNDAQQRVEATAENDAASDHSSDYEEFIPRNREYIEKGSDAQSSYTRPDLEAKEANLEHREERDLTQQKQINSLSGDIEKQQKLDQCDKESEQMLIHYGEACGSVPVPNTHDVNSTWSRDNVAAEAQQDCAVNSLRDTIDLVGALQKYPKCSYSSLGSTYSTTEVDSSSLLDLTLGWSHPCGSVNQVTDSHTLKQSDASAFKQYVRRPVQPLQSTSASTSNQQRGYETSSDGQKSNQVLDHSSDTRVPAVSQQRVLPVTVPVRCLYPDSISSGSAGNVNSVQMIKFGPGTVVNLTQDGCGHHSTPREAALTRFRMKQKDRCFDKKVRYENRKNPN